MFAPTRIAMVGNPNVGKTSLFNRLCGVRAKTANFSGSTVEARVGTAVADGVELELVDLPGIYAIDLELPESKLCRDCLAGRLEGCMPEALLVVLDATNLARGLRLFRSVASLGRPISVALTMTDLARAKGLSIDAQRLAVALGVPCVEANGRAGTGISPLITAMRAAREPSAEMRAACLAPAWVDETVAASIGGPNTIGSETDRMTDRLDAAFTHPVLGAIVFILAMAAVFFTIYRLAEFPMTIIEDACTWLGASLARTLPEGDLSSLLVDGIIGGVAGTIVFLPQICLLFFLLALLEDTGYLARAAFVMDRIMCRFGLPGQAFVPLLSSHACALPGIMSTRLIPDPKDRLATILVAPFMSCSARVGVYVLLVTLIFPHSALYAGLAFAGCYALGAIAALLTAFLFRRTILRGKSRPMVLELPPYRLPDVRAALLTTWDRALVFLKNAGTVILAICVVLWWMSAYPKSAPPEAAVALEARAVAIESSLTNGAVRDNPHIEDTKIEEINALRGEAEVLSQRAQQEHSFAGRFGTAIQPVFAPLGLDDRLTIAVLTSFLAREVFRSTMTVLVGQG
ncbi:MAG: ferrous iron transporter B, partial [Limnohabitans sp.]|nr:ferrous iron transporter B [Limnohabitans sp.]